MNKAHLLTAAILSSALLLSACSKTETDVPAAIVEAPAPAKDILEGAWTSEQTAPLLAKTMDLRLSFDDSLLSDGEKLAVAELLLAGDRLHTLYLEQAHPEARAAEAALKNMNGRDDLKQLFRMMKGPMAVTLDNNIEPFLNVEPETTTGNIYPKGLTREAFDAHMDAYPEERAFLMHLRGVVRAATPEAKRAAIAQLDANPIHDTLHPNLRPHIERAVDYFALPYSVAYADDIFYIYDRLNAAAEHVREGDVDFARYLRLRARDLLADNYDGGDAAWITGKFTGNLNAQIGSYETYDDALYGVKSFFSLSLLQRDKPKSDELAASIGDIQSIENALPYTANKSVRSDIPVGVYNVIADFGQSRGTNTATILPNEGHLSRQYGRTILIRSNILRNPKIFAETQNAFNAAISPKHHADFELSGNFYRTLWHEIGHYMGPDQTKDGGDIDGALQNSADLMEEMKADLVSLFSAGKLADTGAFSEGQLKSIYASGIYRVVQKNKPRRSQAYGTMKLIQFNWYRDQGLIAFENGALSIDYARYPAAVKSLLKEVLALQYEGDREAANTFVDQWTEWDDTVHGAIGEAMKQAEGSRYRYVTYEALGE